MVYATLATRAKELSLVKSVFDVLAKRQSVDQMVNGSLVYAMMFLPAFPGMVRMLRMASMISHHEHPRVRMVPTCRPNCWKILSEVPSGLP